MDREQAANELVRRGVTLEDMQNYFLAFAEPVAAIGSGIVAEPLAGFAGLAAAPFGSDAAANAVNYYRDKLTYSPRSEAGQSGMAAVGEAMAPIGEAMDYAASGAGDYIYDKTGSPALAAAAYSAPTAALELLGLKGVNQLSKSGKLGKQLEFGDIGSGGVGNKQRGIFAGVKAKGADLKRQAAAEELAKRGVGRDQIWQETGWFNDVDGNWKFEIDDSRAKPRDMMNTIPDAAAQLDEFDEVMGPLGKGLTHPDARKAYPDEFKDIDYIVKPYSDGGFYRGGEIQVGTDYRHGDKSIKGDKSTTLHEAQHAIQEREGFARGGSPADMQSVKDSTASELDYQNKRISQLTADAKKTNEYQVLENNLVEALEAGDDARVDGLMEAQADYLNNFPLLGGHEAKARKLSKALADIGRPDAAYKRLAGEAEARNVQTRMNYTPAQRKAAAPWTTLDVPESELIVRGNSNGPMMSVREQVVVALPSNADGVRRFKEIKAIDPDAKAVRGDAGITVSYRDSYKPKQVDTGNSFLFDFDPDALLTTEKGFKNTSNYQGDSAKPITVTKSGGEFHILDGHHRAKIAKEQGKEVRAVVIPESDFKVMSEKKIHQGDMLKEWIATGGPKKTPVTAQ